MEIALFGEFEMLAMTLKGKGVSCDAYDAASIPSLTAMLAAHADITSIVMRADQLDRWSDGHILAAAKALQSKGRFLIYGNSPEAERLKSSPLVICVSSEADALKLLLRPKGGAAAMAAKATMGETTSSPVAELEFDARPIKGSDKRTYLIEVVGSQPRIGCTTQAIRLWHYCKTLGLDPAVLVTEGQLNTLYKTVGGEWRPDDSCVIDHVVFSPREDNGFDCYIRDVPFGCYDKETLADAVLLVVGSKPWEVCNSLEMLYRVPGGRTAAIVSFATEKAAQELRDMFGDKVTAIVAAPYIPDPWAGADDALLRLYDMLLRPILEMEAPRELKDNNYKEEDLEAWYSENLQEIL